MNFKGIIWMKSQFKSIFIKGIGDKVFNFFTRFDLKKTIKDTLLSEKAVIVLKTYS